MSTRYYRLLPAVVASLSLLLPVLLAGCGSDRAAGPRIAAAGPTAAASQPQEVNTEDTIWTVLGFAKKPEKTVGPQTGDQVSPILWQAAHDTLNFVRIASEDPMSGVIMSEWYSPPGKPQQRLRVAVFILSRALRSDSVSVTIDRQERTQSGEWKQTPIARDAVAELESAILLRARHLRAERYRDTS